MVKQRKRYLCSVFDAEQADSLDGEEDMLDTGAVVNAARACACSDIDRSGCNFNLLEPCDRLHPQLPRV